MADHKCPVCAGDLTPNTEELTIDYLLRLWEPIVFSSQTIAELKLQGEYTQLYVCSHCTLETFFPQIIAPPSFYAELEGGASGGYYVDDKWDFTEALKDIKYFEAIVEIGCGPGVFMGKARSFVNEVIGVEYSKLALESARSKGLNVYSFEDSFLEIRGQMDAAFSFHVLEHVPDPVAFMQEMCSWIKPDGKIGISVPNMDGPIKYIEPCASNMPPHHATRWKLKSLRMLADKAGLVVDRVAYEPLVVRDHYYYSYYWVGQTLLAKIVPVKIFRIFEKSADWLFYRVFECLAKFNKKEISLLKGQSIYILLSKQKGK
jgi:SAM-dependent methyltransferase